MDQHETKVCTKCGETRPLSDFYIKNKRTGARRSWCRFCLVEASNAKYHARVAALPKPEPAPAPTEKACTKCGRVLPIEQFPVKQHKTGTRRAICAECKRAEGAQYRKANLERIRAQSAEYREKNKAEIAERQRQWRLDHPEAYQEIHSKWKRTHTSSVNASTHKRRARIVDNGGHWTADEWEALKARYDHKCLMCGRQEPEIKLTVDHIVPVAKGGSNGIDNIQPLCKSCNSKKHQGIIDLRKLKE